MREFSPIYLVIREKFEDGLVKTAEPRNPAKSGKFIDGCSKFGNPILDNSIDDS
jgi:hypothetical protein